MNHNMDANSEPKSTQWLTHIDSTPDEISGPAEYKLNLSLTY